MASCSALLMGAVLMGVYYGTNMQDKPFPEQVKFICEKYNIMKVRLHEADTGIFHQFRFNPNNVAFTFGIPNTKLKEMRDNSTVQIWFEKFVKPYIGLVNFEYIVVGEDGHDNILPTMQLLQSLINANSYNEYVKLTTIIDYTSLITKDLPSFGAFNPNMKDNVRDILNFLVEQGSPDLMVSLYPFKKYVYDNRGVISIDYATFGEKVDTVQDGSFIYHNLFDAMVDTIYAAIEKLGDERLNKVNVVIGETGWPTDGRGADTSIALASKYNNKLIEHLSFGKGTPRRPNVNIKCFIRSLFNENLRPEGESRYYGLFRVNSTPFYPLFKGF